jgi:hypothetical protein
MGIGGLARSAARGVQFLGAGTKKLFDLAVARQSTVSVAFMRNSTPNLTSRARHYPPSAYGMGRPLAATSLDAFVAGCAAYLGDF